MNEEFLKYYIENQFYIQNPPMDIEEFVKFCKKRGINISIGELELYEKEGFFYPIFRTKNEFYGNMFHKYVFDKCEKNSCNFARNMVYFYSYKSNRRKTEDRSVWQR